MNNMPESLAEVEVVIKLAYTQASEAIEEDIKAEAKGKDIYFISPELEEKFKKIFFAKWESYSGKITVMVPLAESEQKKCFEEITHEIKKNDFLIAHFDQVLLQNWLKREFLKRVRLIIQEAQRAMWKNLPRK